MCCEADKQSSDEFYEILKKEGWVWGYKYVVIVTNQPIKITSYYHFNHIWKPGWNKCNGKIRTYKNRKYITEIYQGIHVYRESKFCDGYHNSNMKVKCYLKDFVGADKSSAVFTKVYLLKEEYDRVINDYI